jgi:hypothetical protein
MLLSEYQIFQSTLFSMVDTALLKRYDHCYGVLVSTLYPLLILYTNVYCPNFLIYKGNISYIYIITVGNEPPKGSLWDTTLLRPSIWYRPQRRRGRQNHPLPPLWTQQLRVERKRGKPRLQRGSPQPLRGRPQRRRGRTDKPSALKLYPKRS